MTISNASITCTLTLLTITKTEKYVLDYVPPIMMTFMGKSIYLKLQNLNLSPNNLVLYHLEQT